MAGNGPAFRVKMSRKDKELITFTNHLGEEVTAKYADVGSLWPSKLDNGGFDFSVNRKVTLDPEKYWFTVFPAGERQDGAKSQGGGKSAKPRGNGKQQSSQDDGETDGGDPFAA